MILNVFLTVLYRIALHTVIKEHDFKSMTFLTQVLPYGTFSIAEQLELGEGVIALEPAEVLGEICHSDIMRCPIEQRPVVLKDLEVDDGATFITDVFVQTGSTFNPSQKVTFWI